jgi:hypothetical protein
MQLLDHERLMRLSEAARTLFHSSTGYYTDHEPTLNKIAHIIGRSTKVFTRPDIASEYELVMPDEIEEGTFHLGGAYLELPHPRPALANLAILRDELSKSLREVREQPQREGRNT